MQLSTAWQRRLAAIGTRKQVLVTLDLGRGDPGDDQHHIGLHGQAITLTNGVTADVVSMTGQTLQFLPFVANWPTVTRTLRPEERKAEIADVTVEVLGSARLAETIMASGTAAGATARIDLWSPGIELENVLPLAAGRVTQAQWDRATSGVRLTVTDGAPNQSYEFPGTITRDHFPLAPAASIGLSRTTVFGPFTQPVSCIQIDAERRKFYVADPPLQGVAYVWKGGAPLPPGYTFAGYIETSPLGLRYSVIEFSMPIDEIAVGITDEITVSDGVGIMDLDPITFLLDYAGIPLTDRAKFLLGLYRAEPKFTMAVDIGATGDALSIVRDRLVPQTPFAFTMNRGRADLIPLFHVSGTPVDRQAIGMGNGLVFRLAKQSAETAPENIVNAFEATVADSVQVLRDKDHGTDDVPELLRRSEMAHGRRWLHVDLPDVPVQVDADGVPYASAGGRELIDGFARLSALPHDRHGYQATWLHGMAVDLGQRMELTDDDEALSAVPVRVAGLTYASTGPQVIFQTEDES